MLLLLHCLSLVQRLNCVHQKRQSWSFSREITYGEGPIPPLYCKGNTGAPRNV